MRPMRMERCRRGEWDGREESTAGWLWARRRGRACREVDRGFALCGRVAVASKGIPEACMRFLSVAPVALTMVGLLTVACGGEDGDGKATSTAVPGDPGAVGANLTPTPTPPPMKKPAPPPAQGVALEISGPQFFGPSISELKGLMTTPITVNGKTYTGVTLAALAERVKAPAGVVMTVQGYRSDYSRIVFHRSEVAANGATTVLYIDSEGYINMASTTIPEADWLKAVMTVGFP